MAKLIEDASNRASIELFISKIECILKHAPSTVAEQYCDWALDPDSYRFGSEAHYQQSILFWLLKAHRMGHFPSRTPLFVARQIFRPSAFRNTPRIKRIANTAFLLFPQSGMFWFYQFMAMAMASMHGRPICEEKLREYVYYVLAASAFQAKASPTTAFAIDFVLDSVALGEREIVPWQGSTSEAMWIIRAAEDFFVTHEIAHAALEHRATFDQKTMDSLESAADTTAIEIMMFGEIPEHATRDGNPVQVSDRAAIGYLALMHWGIFRLAAEERVAVLRATSQQALNATRRHVSDLVASRERRVKGVGQLPKIRVSDDIRNFDKACRNVAELLRSLDINDAEVAIIARRAESYAGRDYASLNNEIVDSMGDWARRHGDG